MVRDRPADTVYYHHKPTVRGRGWGREEGESEGGRREGGGEGEAKQSGCAWLA